MAAADNQIRIMLGAPSRATGSGMTRASCKAGTLLRSPPIRVDILLPRSNRAGVSKVEPVYTKTPENRLFCAVNGA
jgi:hypothetical protein